MATCTAFKIIFNNTLLPDIYFSYEAARQALFALKESNIGCGRVVNIDNETGEVL